LPTDIVAIQENELPIALVKCIELAAQKAESLREGLRVKPVLITSYRDGQKMVTVTCAITEDSSEERFPGPSFARWKFACKSWRDIQSISVPILSSKEQYRLNALLHLGAKKALAGLKFMPADDKPSSLDAINSYKSFQRYYPSFRHVED
jgi:putative O-methyltransferase